jgi:hypothetical protein
LEVKISEGAITKAANSTTDYIAKVNKTGKVKIETWHQGKILETMEFRVKRIPDPYIRFDLPYRYSCFGSGGKLTDAKKLVAILENFNFEAKCEIVSFHFTHNPKGEKQPIEYDNQGGVFNERVTSQIKNAKPGDIVYFDKVKVRCLGDTNVRELNGLVYAIK